MTAAPAPRVPPRRYVAKPQIERLPPEAATRQGQVASLAYRTLGREAAIAFLNAHDAQLGGRPIDLAIANPAGLARVESRLLERGARGG